MNSTVTRPPDIPPCPASVSLAFVREACLRAVEDAAVAFREKRREQAGQA